jgi:hypothetical protein
MLFTMAGAFAYYCVSPLCRPKLTSTHSVFIGTQISQPVRGRFSGSGETMRPKAHYQLRPRQAAALRNPSPEKRNPSRPNEIQNPALESAYEDIKKFLDALDSFPECLSKDPRLSFHNHLCRIIAAHNPRASAGAVHRHSETKAAR